VDPSSEDARWAPWLRALIFVGSAALAAATLRFAWHEPLISAAALGALFLFFGARWLSRWRLRKILRSGNVYSVLERWSASLERLPHPDTMGPILTATAFAACGWVEQARAALATAERGPAWDAALEHRLFLDALLLTFEGDREAALEQASRLERLPLPPVSDLLRARMARLRGAIGALTRAFAHQSHPGDRELLEHASETSPLVFWAMRYAAAVIAIDDGDTSKAWTLLSGAPSWPEQSTFRAFHDEMVQKLSSMAAGSAA